MKTTREILDRSAALTTGVGSSVLHEIAPGYFICRAMALVLILVCCNPAFRALGADCWYDNCHLCNAKRVHFDLANEAGTCVYVMHLPCQRLVTAFCFGSDCCTGIGA